MKKILEASGVKYDAETDMTTFFLQRFDVSDDGTIHTFWTENPSIHGQPNINAYLLSIAVDPEISVQVTDTPTPGDMTA